MKKHEFSCISTGTYFVGTVLFGGLLWGCIWALGMLKDEPMPSAGLAVLVRGMVLCFAAAAVVFLWLYFYWYMSRIVVDCAGVALYRFGRRVRHFPVEQVCAYGSACFYHRGSAVFFCTVPEGEIWKFFEEHEARAGELYAEAYDRLAETPAGRWEMAVGLFLRYGARAHRDQVITTNEGCWKSLAATWQLWNREPMLTGPVHLQDPQQEARLRRDLRRELDRIAPK